MLLLNCPVQLGSPLRRIAKGKQMNEETKHANLTLQAFKLKEKERNREAELAVEGECAGTTEQRLSS